MKKILYSLFLIGCFAGLNGQEDKAAALRKIISDKNSNDTSVVNAMNQLGEAIYTSLPDSALNLWINVEKKCKEALKTKLAPEIRRSFQFHLSASLNNQGYIYQGRGESTKAVPLIKESLKISEELNDVQSILFCYNNLGFNLAALGDSPEALRMYNMHLALAQRKGTKFDVMKSLIVLGDQYKHMGDYVNAVKDMERAFQLSVELQNHDEQENILIQIGNIYFEKSDYTTSNEFYNKCLKLAEKQGNQSIIATCYNNLASNYYKLSKFEEAIFYYRKSYVLRQKEGDLNTLITAYRNMASGFYNLNLKDSSVYYLNKAMALAKQLNSKAHQVNISSAICHHYFVDKQFDKAGEYGELALDIAKEIHSAVYIRDIALKLKQIYMAKKKFEKAVEMQSLYFLMRDSLNNTATNKAMVNSQLKYEYESKMLADSLSIEGEKKIMETQSEHERTQRYFLLGGLGLLAAFAFVMYNRFRITNKQKKIIEIKERESSEQKKIVEEKNKEIVDSINYSKRLQEAILPSAASIAQALPQSFLLYKPKDIVAGDFYWMENLKTNDGKEDLLLFAAADCTGHGVPGAMVSLVCANALHRTVVEFGITDTGKILDKARELVLETFAKGQSEVKDGMDISLISLRSSPTAKKIKVQWSGANNPLWYISENAFKELAPDKQSIGLTENPKPFTTHEMEMEKGTIFYLFTDGYADQFGGPKGKKFKYKQMSELFQEVSSLKMSEQKIKIEQRMNDWMGNTEQVDDICIVGIKL